MRMQVILGSSFARVHSRPQRPRSFWSALKITTSGQVQLRSPRFTDFPLLCACSESSLTNLIGSGLNLLCLQSHSKPECRWTWPEVRPEVVISVLTKRIAASGDENGPGWAPMWGGKKGEFKDWTTLTATHSGSAFLSLKLTNNEQASIFQLLDGTEWFEAEPGQDGNFVDPFAVSRGACTWLPAIWRWMNFHLWQNKSLGVIVDKHVTFDAQIDHACKSSINHLRNLFRIRRYTVSWRERCFNGYTCIYNHTHALDYCNHLYFGRPMYKVKKLQQIQNIAARYLTCARKYDHITPVLVQLHWLPVLYRIVFKDLLFVYKSLNGLCPQYLTNLLEHRKSARSLSNFQDLLIQPTCKTKTYGDRAFSVCAPKIWNTVLLEIRQSSTVVLFKKTLKTFLFTRFIESNSLSYF